jgi:hypothetical protein
MIHQQHFWRNHLGPLNRWSTGVVTRSNCILWPTVLALARLDPLIRGQLGNRFDKPSVLLGGIDYEIPCWSGVRSGE